MNDRWPFSSERLAAAFEMASFDLGELSASILLYNSLSQLDSDFLPRKLAQSDNCPGYYAEAVNYGIERILSRLESIRTDIRTAAVTAEYVFFCQYESQVWDEVVASSPRTVFAYIDCGCIAVPRRLSFLGNNFTAVSLAEMRTRRFENAILVVSSLGYRDSLHELYLDTTSKLVLDFAPVAFERRIIYPLLDKPLSFHPAESWVTGTPTGGNLSVFR